MRILHVVSNISKKGGVMSVIMNYYRKLTLKGYIFDFLYFEEYEPTYTDEIHKYHGEVFKIVSPTDLIRYKRELRKFFENHRGEYDVIHIHDVFLINFFRMARNYDINGIIAHAHNPYFSENRFKNIIKIYTSISRFFLPDYYLACSEESGRNLFGKRFLIKGTVLKNAIDLKKFYIQEDKRKNMRSQWSLDDKFVIGHIGNFNKQKNQEFLIDIFYRVSKIKKNARLILVGDGELRKRVQKKCDELKLNNKVFFLGVREDVHEIINMFDVFVFPSLFEGCGIVLLESQACGIPCVYSDKVIPDNTNILSEINTRLLLSDPVEKWAEAIALKTGHIVHENEVKERFIRAGYDIDRESEKLEKIYLECMQS